MPRKVVPAITAAQLSITTGFFRTTAIEVSIRGHEVQLLLRAAAAATPPSARTATKAKTAPKAAADQKHPSPSGSSR